MTALASSLLPGLGHLLLRLRNAGITLIAVDLSLGVVALAVWISKPIAALEAWVTPSALTGLVVLNVGVFLYRTAATLHSFLRSRSPVGFDWILGTIAAFILVVPHAWVGALTATQSDLITTVFAASDPVTTSMSTTTTAPAPPPEITTTTAPAPTTTAPTTTTTTALPRIWDGHERLNILLLGSDAGVGRRGTRTDTIVLVSIEPAGGDIAMFSVPRNLTEAPLPEGMGIWGCDCFPDIITHLWANGEWYPEAFPGPQSASVNAIKAAVGLIFDVDVHYYAKVDLAGFVGIVDALGGVTIDVPERLVDEGYPHELGGTEYVLFEEGTQHLDGHLALAYSRIRRHSGDFARMHRQRCVLGALADQASPVDLLTGYDDFAGAIETYVETDIPLDRLGDLIDLLPKIEFDRVATLRITAHNYGSAGHPGYQLYDLDRIRSDAHLLMADPTLHLDTQDGDGFEATCDLSFD